MIVDCSNTCQSTDLTLDLNTQVTPESSSHSGSLLTRALDTRSARTINSLGPLGTRLSRRSTCSSSWPTRSLCPSTFDLGIRTGSLGPHGHTTHSDHSSIRVLKRLSTRPTRHRRIETQHLSHTGSGSLGNSAKQSETPHLAIPALL